MNGAIDISNHIYEKNFIFSIPLLLKKQTLCQHIWGYGNATNEIVKISLINNELIITFEGEIISNNKLISIDLIF